MKQFCSLLTVILFAINLQAQQAPFITTWEVTAGSLDITIPTSGTGYDYTIDFGDGTILTNQTGNASHTYSTAGIYTVSITGDFPRIYFFSSPINNKTKIKSIEQWGGIEWQSMEGAFHGCSNLVINALDIPDLNQVTSMAYMFVGTTSFNQSINNWDVSSITNVSAMFVNATLFNQPLHNWDVSSVTNMNGMFIGAESFNQPLHNWDVSNVTNMGGMFSGTSFNQLLHNWDVSNVTDMSYMFSEVSSFNQDINNWNVSSVTNMSYMFAAADLFNQPLNNWNVSSVTDFSGMFLYASSFNQDISSWQVNMGSLDQFLNNSALDVVNYDTFLTQLASLGITSGYLGGDGLVYCNQGARDYLINVLGWNIYDNGLSSDCNAIVGDILYDQNNNGCDPNDIKVNGFMINANDGLYDFTTFSNDGTYHLDITGTSFTVSIVNAPSYYTISPASANVTFSGSNTEVLDFCVTANQTIEDVNITLLPISEARPGFEADYRLVVQNVGTETIANVEATLAFDDLMQQFVIANPAPATTTTATLTFPIGTMQPFQTFEADITMLTFQPPTVNGGDILDFTAEATPMANDHTPNDNTYPLAQVVVNSYDPNDKQVLQGEELHIDAVGDYLDYLIRFQNTGTASAINVRILDTLHPKLDWNTLIPISASHDYYVKITEGNRVEFMFDNIHLPDSLSNEPESHGFVAYKIKPKSNVQVGDVITGDAAIYFDFNPPIITNMVSTTIVEPLGISSNPLSHVVLYPNPTSNTLNIHLTEGIELEEVLIYDLQGREVQKIQGAETVLDIESLTSGVYLLKISTNHGTINRRLIKN